MLIPFSEKTAISRMKWLECMFCTVEHLWCFDFEYLSTSNEVSLSLYGHVNSYLKNQNKTFFNCIQSIENDA